MKKFITIQLPLEVDKTYKTRTQEPENFLVKRIVYHPQEKEKQVWVEGIYENRPHLGLCPLNVDRLAADTEVVENPEFIEAWKNVIQIYHNARKELLDPEMTNSDFCKFMMDNFEFPKMTTNEVTTFKKGKVKRFDMPKFRTVDNGNLLFLNELEVRQMQVDVKEGNLPIGTYVIDATGKTCRIGEGGKFEDGSPYGYSLAYELCKQLLD